MGPIDTTVCLPMQSVVVQLPARQCGAASLRLIARLLGLGLRARFFFEPNQLRFPYPDQAVELFDRCLLFFNLLCVTMIVVKESVDVRQRLLPEADLDRMGVVPACNPCDSSRNG
jgi:hypothetical protein